jgi:uncharacterized protein YdeI (YjbR/CyaY-like superfamily)
VKSFASAAGFRSWLERNHQRATELTVRCARVNATGRGLTYREALDEALCFGWIDGVRRRVDRDSFSVRFSPRKPGSKWSAVNIRKATALEAAGRMRPAGKAAFSARDPRTGRRYSYESRPETLDPAMTRRFRQAPDAWAFFQSQPPGYRRTIIFWVMDAKRPETRHRRFTALLECSGNGQRVPLLSPGPPRKSDR